MEKQLAKTTLKEKTKMFGFTCMCLAKKRAIPAYGMFMIKNKANPILTACKTIGERGKKTAALYRKLSDSDKAKLTAEGKKYRK